MLSLLLRGLLVGSAVALTFCPAAVVDKRESNCGEHTGWLQIGSTTGFLVSVTGWVGNAATGADYGQVSTSNGNRATFQFSGCQGGGVFPLYCKTCDSSNEALAATVPTDVDSNNEPSDWKLYNYGPDGSLPRRENNITLRQESLFSTLFTWDDDNYIRPVTFNNDNTVQEYTLNAWYSAQSNDITYIEGTGAGNEYYVCPIRCYSVD